MHRRCFAIALLAAVSTFTFAQDVPLTNWTVPPYHSGGSSAGITTMTDVTPPRAFVGIQPCRVADTRGNGAPITGGIFANSQARNWTVWGICGIPSGADAISVNFSVVSPAGTPAGAFLLAWPTGQAPPPTAIMTYGPGVTILSNAAIVPLNASGQMTVNVSHSTHIVMDVNGYFSDTLQNTANQFEVRSAGGVAIYGENTASGYGVWGNSANGYGIVGGGGAGGVWATTAGTGSGIYGQHTGTGSPRSAGILGVGAGGGVAQAQAGVAGVRGESRSGTGVEGFAEVGAAGNVSGVEGRAVDAAGNQVAAGVLGWTSLASGIGMASFGNADVFGALSVTGTKSFVEPHPFDPSREIRYVSLEGPHAEVYFRGTAQISQGITRIDIPQDFEFVADPNTYSTLVTPVGNMATVAVLSESGTGIVIRASRDVRIHYVVYAERKAIKNDDPIVENVHFRPAADRDVFATLSESYRRLLIQNGTLRSDGTLNMETARRLGWDKVWEKRNPPVAFPAPQ